MGTDAGVTGWGEACDSYGCSYASVVAARSRRPSLPSWWGQRLDAVEPLAERLRLVARRRLGEGWVAAHARSALELALWDIAGRAAGRSVSAMIGRVRDSVEVYASSVFLEEGTAAFHLDLLDPLLSRGVTWVKLRVGPDWAADLATLTEIRSKLGADIRLMVDGSEIFTLPTAGQIARELGALGVEWFEEPLPQGAHAGIETLAAASAVPIAYGEHLFGADDAIDAMRAAHAAHPAARRLHLRRAGRGRRAAMAAAGFGVRVVPHVCAGPVSLAANLHLAATVPAIRLIEYPPAVARAWSTFAHDARARPRGHRRRPPAGPGRTRASASSWTRRPWPPPLPSTWARVAGTVAGLPDRFVGDRWTCHDGP